MKRIISTVVTVALIMSLLAGLRVTAFADTFVNEVELTMDAVTAGAALPTTATTGEYGTVASLSWEKWNFTTSTWEAFSGNAETGSAYRMTARVTANAGYVFGTACFYYIDGVRHAYAYGDGTYVDVRYVFPVELTEIAEVAFAKEPAVAEGVDAAQALSELAVAADALYTIAETRWYEMDIQNDSRGSFSGTFQKGKIYELGVILEPKAGAWFANDFYASAANLSNYGGEDDEAFVWLNLRYFLTTPVEQVDITVTGVEAGKSSTDVKVNVPAGVNYKLDEITILDRDGNDFTGTIRKDTYTVRVYLNPAEGYHFSDDLKATVNGGQANGISSYNSGCCVETVVDFRAPVDRVDITVTGMEQGKNVEDVKVTVPESCVLDEAGVFDDDWNTVTGVIGKNKYRADIYLAPADGYYFAEDIEVTVNGQEPDYKSSDANYINVEKHCDFREQIKQVELPAWPEVKVGDPVPGTTPVDPEDKQYSYALLWVDYTDGGMAQGTFADNKNYAAIYAVQADAGCKFADDVQIKINGVTHTGVVENLGDGMMLIKIYALGTAKLIDRLDVTVDTPAIGAKPGEPSVAKDADYGLNFSDWGVSDNGKVEGIAPAGEVFRLGEHVYLALEFAVEPGTLDPNAKLFINGKEYAMMREFTEMGRDYFFTVVYLGQLLNEVDTLKVSGGHPTAGRTPSAVVDAGSEHCKLESAVWGVSKEQGKDIQALSGTYAVGDHAYLTLTYAFDENWTAAEDIKILFNGKEYPLVEGMTSVADGKITATIYIGQMKAATTPGTGDTTPVVMLAVLAVASVLGMGVLIGRRKAF